MIPKFNPQTYAEYPFAPSRVVEIFGFDYV